MKLVLNENIRGLGSTGDVVSVRNGYARNYLLPKKLATQPTADNVKKLRKARESYLVRESNKIEGAQLLAAKIRELTISISMKANDAGQLFGSVTEAIIADSLSTELGVVIDQRNVIIGSHFKKIGEHLATIRIHSEVEEEISIVVLPEALVEDENLRSLGELGTEDEEDEGRGRRRPRAAEEQDEASAPEEVEGED